MLKHGTFINLNLKPLMESPSSASVSGFKGINYLELQINVVELRTIQTK